MTDEKVRQKMYHIAVPDPENETQCLVAEECRDLARFLLEKNRKYGNSVMEPVRVFSNADNVEQIRVRLDDKLSRIMSSQSDDDEDVVLDLIGYLVLYRIASRQA